MQPVRIYTTDYCPYCRNAKALLDRKGVPYQEIDVTGDDEAREKLTAQTGLRTVPQIFVGDTLVGGFSDLEALEKAGKLTPLLQGT
ncbi:MAG: glutaredoxin 3 [Myxococcales bacterium]